MIWRLKLALALLSALPLANEETLTVAQRFGPHVMELTWESFDRVLASRGSLFVAFYSPFCGHSLALAGHFGFVASKLRGRVLFARVDATTQIDLVVRFGISNYPVFKHIYEGDSVQDYNGRNTANEMISWLEKSSAPLVPRIALHGFEKLKPGAASCPKEQRIWTKEACARAIKFLGFEPEPMWASSYPELPAYCSFRDVVKGERGHFNAHPGGKARADLAPVCKMDNTAARRKADKDREARKPSQTFFRGYGDAEFLKVFDEAAKLAQSQSDWPMRRFLFLEDAASRIEVHRGLDETLEHAGAFDNATVLAEWFMAETLPSFALADELTSKAAMARSTTGLIWLCLAPKDLAAEVERLAPYLGKFGEVLRGKVALLYLDTVSYEQHALEDLGCGEFPSVVFQRGSMPAAAAGDRVPIVEYHRLLSPGFEPAEVGHFIEDVLKGAVEPSDTGEDEEEEEEAASTTSPKQLDL